MTKKEWLTPKRKFSESADADRSNGNNFLFNIATSMSVEGV